MYSRRYFHRVEAIIPHGDEFAYDFHFSAVDRDMSSNGISSLNPGAFRGAVLMSNLFVLEGFVHFSSFLRVITGLSMFEWNS